MREYRATIAAVLALALAGSANGQAYPPGIDPVRIDRARYNYEAVRDGRRQIAQLTVQELEDVAALDRALRDQKPDGRTTSQRCVDNEMRRLDGPASTLARRVIDMKCREAGEGLR